jgi:two-component system CheB/CheR fusion protein
VIPYPRLVYDSNGKITGAVNTVIDITPQVVALKKVEESEKSLSKLAAIIQFSEDAIISKTLDGIVTSWNPGAQKLFGYTAEEMIGQSITKVIPKDRLNEEPEILRRIQKGEIVDHFETKRLTKGGDLLDISLTISPVKDREGKITGASKIARNITKAKKAEALLKESERQFRQIADSMPQIVWTATPDGHLDYYNRQWYEFTGFEEDYNELSWARILNPDDVQISIDKYHHSIKTGEPYRVEYRFKDHKNPGSFRWFMGRANPVRDQQGNIVKWFGTFTEIDDAKRIQQELELGKQQREDFIKMASHELKTPITTLKGYLQLILNAVKDDENEISPLLIKSSLVTMDKQVNRLTRLMSELLDLSRIEAGQLELNKELFSLNELVIEMVQDVLYTSNKFSINIYHDTECTVHADRDRLGQVLTNLLTNAIKYSPHADKIEVRIYKPEKNRVAVSVKDQGIGVGEKEQEKIFERYYRAEGKSEQTYPGFGVGLYIAGEIIQRHNGKISVESEKGKGSTFTFTLPVETTNK